MDTTLSFCSFMTLYRKPPTISPGLIFFRKRFLMGGGGLIYRGGLYLEVYGMYGFHDFQCI